MTGLTDQDCHFVNLAEGTTPAFKKGARDE